ncbi:MAG TPA: hypothetical protein VGM51_04055 [Armatimonadota bacterium]|jgi:hypothetical protein
MGVTIGASARDSWLEPAVIAGLAIFAADTVSQKAHFRRTAAAAGHPERSAPAFIGYAIGMVPFDVVGTCLCAWLAHYLVQHYGLPAPKITPLFVLMQAFLAALVFLSVLNGFLRGRSKSRVDAVLGMIGVVYFISCFTLCGILQGLVSIGTMLVYGLLARPVAQSVSFRLLGYRTTVRQSDRFGDISMVSGRGEVMEDLFGQMDAKSEKQRNYIEAVAISEPIAHLLQQHGKSVDDLSDDMHYLLAAGLGDLSYDLISEPASLVRLWELQAQGLPSIDVAWALSSHRGD